MLYSARVDGLRGDAANDDEIHCSIQSASVIFESTSVLAEGLDPDDPAVIAAISLVRWELSLYSADITACLLSVECRNLMWSAKWSAGQNPAAVRAENRL